MKTVVVIGDRLADLYVHGRLADCQDGCPKFIEESRFIVPGGAGNAIRTLEHAICKVVGFTGSMAEDKIRFLADGKVVFRHDVKKLPFGDWNDGVRRETLRWLKKNPFDGVYLSDYNKGFLTDDLIRVVIRICRQKGVPVVADPKRHPAAFFGAIIKCNIGYHGDYADSIILHVPRVVTNGRLVTQGSNAPTVITADQTRQLHDVSDVPCVSHVGAGDCFGAWLTWKLAEGLPLVEAARWAHAAGRVYVQHLHNRAPLLSEVEAELNR